ncbi:MAG: SHOCT domain-containing protein [Firmicutes bacterium]|nr:SHOCT domain-containing protein [Bacillota bacterium]MBQ3199605.1 SHOCT domain-containing protein [Bacillota bacterium]
MAPKKIKVQPGRTQSKMGFVIGILFVLIGCFIVIPTFGPFGIVWTAIAGVIAFTHYKNGFSDEGIATHEIIIEDGKDGEYDGRGEYGMDMPKAHDDREDIEAKLIKLNSLYDRQLITREEYDEKRRELLDEF